MKRLDARMVEALAIASQVGIFLGAAVVVGVLGGSYLDGKLGTSPTFLIVGSLLGMVVGIYTAWRTAAFILGKVQKQRDKTTEDR
jgi:F0F1-type ATP synthase assembly protein I